MNRDLKRFRFDIALVTQYPRFFLVLSLLIALFFVSFVPFTKTEQNVDYLILEDDPDVTFYNAFKEVFGNDEFFIIAFEKEDIFTKKNLTLLKRITEDLENLEQAEEVTSLANVDDTIGGTDYFEVRKFLEDIPDDENQLSRLKELATRNPLYLHNLISPDARTAAIFVRPYDRPDDEQYTKRLLDKTHEILDRYGNEIDKFYLAGRTTTSATLSHYMKIDVAKFIPITYLLIILAIWAVFRNARLTVLALGNISLCVGSTMGLLGLTGITLNNVTSIIPPLVMALALCDTVHIFSHMDKAVLSKYADKRKALAGVLQRVVLPSFLTTLTTAVGFLSLAVSELRPIREFAYVASSGMIFEFIYSFFLLPPLILCFKAERVYVEYPTQRGIAAFLVRIRNLVSRHPRLIALASAAVILTSLWFGSQLKVETNLIKFFKSHTDFRKSLDFVEKRLGGVDTLDISLKAEHVDAFREPSNLRIIERVQKYIDSLRGIDVTVSFVDFMKDMNESFHDEDPRYYTIPETVELVSQYLLLYDSDEIEDMINSSYDHARISVRMSEHSSARHKSLIDEIKQYIGETKNSDLDITVTGTAVQQVNTIDSLVRGQVYSLGLAAGTIAVIMFLVLRSAALGALSIVPNLFPIILNFGVMGAVGIPLDTGTALIAAVALGIAVDDTIHFLSEYKMQRAQKVSIQKSVENVISVKGRAIISSSIILCIGFGVLVLSSFVPTMHFGLLNAIIMVTAVAGDLVVLPSIMLLRKAVQEVAVTGS
jgi:predicted RND superfamily exporter protein